MTSGQTPGWFSESFSVLPFGRNNSPPASNPINSESFTLPVCDEICLTQLTVTTLKSSTQVMVNLSDGTSISVPSTLLSVTPIRPLKLGVTSMSGDE